MNGGCKELTSIQLEELLNNLLAELLERETVDGDSR